MLFLLKLFLAQSDSMLAGTGAARLYRQMHNRIICFHRCTAFPLDMWIVNDTRMEVSVADMPPTGAFQPALIDAFPGKRNKLRQTGNWNANVTADFFQSVQVLERIG